MRFKLQCCICLSYFGICLLFVCRKTDEKYTYKSAGKGGKIGRMMKKIVINQ